MLTNIWATPYSLYNVYNDIMEAVKGGYYSEHLQGNTTAAPERWKSAQYRQGDGDIP